jgi:hypothetical protein
MEPLAPALDRFRLMARLLARDAVRQAQRGPSFDTLGGRTIDTFALGTCTST